VDKFNLFVILIYYKIHVVLKKDTICLVMVIVFVIGIVGIYSAFKTDDMAEQKMGLEKSDNVDPDDILDPIDPLED